MHVKRGPVLGMLAAAVGSTLIVNGEAPATVSASAAEDGMEKVTGIGGFFFRASDPESLTKWYHEHLGILPVPTSYGAPSWKQEAGETAFAPFPQSTDYFGDAHKSWMMNFRVRDLDKMVQQLQAAGIAVKVDPQKYPNGRFARLHDPEGNPIELWEPAGLASTKDS